MAQSDLSVEGGLMSRTTIAFASFALGVLTTLLVAPAGNHTSTWAQEPPRAIPPGAIGVGGGGVPVVPPISQHFTDFGISGSVMAFNVDGAECVRCTFNGPVLRYGGGNFQFTDFSFSGPVRVELTGAARNTVIFLRFVQGLTAGQAPTQKAPSAPLIQTATVKDTIKGSFGSE
jgi:hypothetical protein